MEINPQTTPEKLYVEEMWMEYENIEMKAYLYNILIYCHIYLVKLCLKYWLTKNIQLEEEKYRDWNVQGNGKILTDE